MWFGLVYPRCTVLELLVFWCHGTGIEEANTIQGELEGVLRMINGLIVDDGEEDGWFLAIIFTTEFHACLFVLVQNDSLQPYASRL